MEFAVLACLCIDDFGPVPEATYWAYTRAFCKDTSEEDLPKRAKKAARKFVKAEQAMMNGED